MWIRDRVWVDVARVIACILIIANHMGASTGCPAMPRQRPNAARADQKPLPASPFSHAYICLLYTSRCV